MGHWYLGTIGFSYKDWLGEFYPAGTSQRDYLSYYCKVFNCVELDTTFHSVPQASKVQSWAASTPRDFIFCLKTPRAITHEHELIGAQGMMDEFLEALRPLQNKVGPILIQLPPSYVQDYVSLTGFLENLSPSHRYAIEFRHLSWYTDQTQQLLAHYRVCWATIDFPNLPKLIYPTTDFLYLRWIGVNGMYQHHTYERVNKTEQLKSWLKAIKPFQGDMSAIYGFFNNDYTGFAAGTCRRFMQLAGLVTNEPNVPRQERLF